MQHSSATGNASRSRGGRGGGILTKTPTMNSPPEAGLVSHIIMIDLLLYVVALLSTQTDADLEELRWQTKQRIFLGLLAEVKHSSAT